MLTGRLNGGSAATSAPSIRIRPSVARSKPAISLQGGRLARARRAKDGQELTATSTASEMPSSAVNVPNRLVSPCSSTIALTAPL